MSLSRNFDSSNNLCHTSTVTRQGWISKRVLRENKTRQFFQKTSISNPLIRIRNVRFRKIWRALFSWNTRFEIRPFLPYYRQYLSLIPGINKATTIIYKPTKTKARWLCFVIRFNFEKIKTRKRKNPAGICLIKANKRKTRTMRET